MSDETYERILDFLRRNVPRDPHGRLGDLAKVPVYVSAQVPDDEPVLSEEPYAVGIRLSPADHADLRHRLDGERRLVLAATNGMGC